MIILIGGSGVSPIRPESFGFDCVDQTPVQTEPEIFPVGTLTDEADEKCQIQKSARPDRTD